MAFFYSLSCVFKHKQDIFLFLNMQNIKSNYYIIFLKLWKIYSFPVICILKRFNFCYCLRRFFLFLQNLRQLLQHIESIYYLFWLIGFIVAFLSNQENRSMIHHYSDLFYDIYNAITEHDGRQTHHHSLIQWIKKLVFNFIYIITNHNCIQLHFPCVRFLKIIYDAFQVWSNCIKIFFNWCCFLSPWLLYSI